MEPRLVHFKKEPYDVYIGRPSKWGNPFSSKPGTLAKYQVNTRGQSIEHHRLWVLSQPEFINEIKRELKGKVLGCWCENKPCHGNILIGLANDWPIEDNKPSSENEESQQNTLF